MLMKRFLFGKTTGEAILWFASKMGVVYIKFAQILAMQNYGDLFTEEDRIALSKICDHCNPIPYKKILKVIEKEYGCSWQEKFLKIYDDPVGSASISQVHKAILRNGDVVAVKVKRKDITKRIHKDIKQLDRVVKRFGRIVKFKNYFGSETALKMLLSWIHEEIDFERELSNIHHYTDFANRVNGKVRGTVDIVVPKVYSQMCTQNIIVMEFIFSKTINQLSLTDENKERISRALNDYIRLSFYALFHDEVTFHGDPHGGNIYIDEKGNVGFLDMGLIFDIQKTESELIRSLFLNAYTGNCEKLVDILLQGSKHDDVDMDSFLGGIENCCNEFRKEPVTKFFMDMINVFTRFNVAPPKILFKMAKAFVALYGINTFVDNSLDTENLLFGQITEYYVNRTFRDLEDVLVSGVKVVPSFFKNVLQHGFAKGISEEIVALGNLNQKLHSSLEHFNELLAYFK